MAQLQNKLYTYKKMKDSNFPLPSRWIAILTIHDLSLSMQNHFSYPVSNTLLTPNDY
jgi:hypothetical protein